MARAELPIAADRYIDDVRFDLPAVFVADAPFIESSGAEVLDNYVGPGGELEENLASLLMPQIECQAALVAVDGRMHKTDASAVAGQIGRQLAGDFPIDCLNLDHVGTQIGQQASQHRPGPTGSRFERTNAVERTGEIMARRYKELS